MNRRWHRARLATVLVAGVAAPAAAGPALAQADSAMPRSFFGIQAWTLPPTAKDVAMIERGGATTLRVVFDGKTLARPQHAGRWAPYDTLMEAAARKRIEILPVLLGMPTRRGLKRPRTRTDFRVWGSYVSAVAHRYGRGGSFWKANPALVPAPLTAYQVWNEPNLPAYWRPARDVAGYLRLLRLTRARLRAVDPEALIVLAGLPESRRGTPMLDYVRAIYARPGARTLFDVVALHPYADDAPAVLNALNRVRAHMDSRGDRRTPIWVTEVGWATGGPRSPFTTTRAGQAARVTRTFKTLLAARRRLRLQRLVLFGLQDRAYAPTEAPWWGPRTGLFDILGRPKPAWRTFVGFTGGRPGGRLPRVVGPARAHNGRRGR